METIRTRQLEAEISIYRTALKRIAECADAPNIDPVGDTEFGLHCGVEDRDASNRYEGANIGYAQGCEAALEWAVNEAKHALEKVFYPKKSQGKLSGCSDSEFNSSEVGSRSDTC